MGITSYSENRIYKNSIFDHDGKFYANVDYRYKDQAKRLGAKWDLDLRRWYFLNSRSRHDWDINHTFLKSDAMLYIDNYLHYRDIFDTIDYLYKELVSNNQSSYIYASYENFVNYLLNKYGVVPYDYFDSNFNNNYKLNSKTRFGLEIHHIDENQYLRLSEPEYAKLSPLSCQKSDRLVYCNKIEHLILHLLIGEQYMRSSNGIYYTYGPKTILSKINDLYQNFFTYGEQIYTGSEFWKKNITTAIVDSIDEYIVLLVYIYHVLTSKYNVNPDKAFKLITSSRNGDDDYIISQKCYNVIEWLNFECNIESRLVDKFLIKASNIHEEYTIPEDRFSWKPVS